MAFVTCGCLKLAGFSPCSSLGELPEEIHVLGHIGTGGAIEEDLPVAEREFDFFDLKGALEAAVDWMN